MGSNIYELFNMLEIEPTKDFDKIKTKYLELIKERHQSAGQSSEQLKEFMDLKEAYDAVRKDRALLEVIHNKAIESPSEVGIASNHSRFNNPLSNVFNTNNGVKDAPRKGSSINKTLDIEFFEALNGVVKKVPVSVTMKCYTCLGKGKIIPVNTCDQCGGKGKYMQKTTGPFGTTETERRCRKCSEERGVSITKEECGTCNGSGNIKSEDLVEVTIPKGTQDKHIIVKEGFGFKGLNGGQNGDLEIQVNVLPLGGYSIINGKLHVEVDVKYSILLTGGDVFIDLGNRQISINIPKHHDISKTISSKGNGIEKNGLSGELIVVPRLYLPPANAPDISMDALDILIDNDL